MVSSKHPRVATIERMVKRRPKGTVYVDYLQNILGKTLATAYSARATEWAGVSTPLTWKEVARGVDPRDYTIRSALARFQKTGDLWAELRTARPVDLKSVLARAGRAISASISAADFMPSPRPAILLRITSRPARVAVSVPAR